MPKSVKVVFAGHSNAGKSSILSRLEKSRIDYITPTIGAAFARKTLLCGTDLVNIDIWDTAGQERYFALSKLYFRNTTYCFLTFDLSDQNSFELIHDWKTICDKTNPDSPPYYFLIGNKTDKPYHPISNQRIKEYCDNNNITHYAETSALNGNGIVELWDALAEHITLNHTAELPKENTKIELVDTCMC